MEPLLKVAWALLALVHAVPAAALVAPGALRRLYGIEPGGELAVLLTHRGALFLALTVLGAFAAVDPAVRRVAGGVITISVVSFLVLYVRAGAPDGPLRRVALVDGAALLPLALVLVGAWRGPHTSALASTWRRTGTRRRPSPSRSTPRSPSPYPTRPRLRGATSPSSLPTCGTTSSRLVRRRPYSTRMSPLRTPPQGETSRFQVAVVSPWGQAGSGSAARPG
jgi:hypothetical protein